MLLEQSREHGLLGADQHELLTSMLELQGTTVAQVMEPFDRIVTVRRDDSAERIEQVSRDSGRSRLAVLDAAGDVLRPGARPGGGRGPPPAGRRPPPPT